MRDYNDIAKIPKGSLKEGKIASLVDLVNKQLLSIEKASKLADNTIKRFRELMK